MFACVNDQDDDGSLSFSTRRWRSARKQAELEDEIVNKVLEEGLRLKQTCKLLKAQLHDVETQRAAEHEAHERYIAKREREFKEEMSKAVSGLAIECARLRDSNSAEIEDLNRQINVLKYEAARKEAKAATERDESSSTTTCQTIAALEIEIAALKDEILAVREDKERELAMMRHEYEAEKKAYIMRREEALDDQRSAMLRRALIAENESQRLLSELSNAETKVRRLQEEICGAQQTRSKQALGNLNEEIDRLRDIVEKNHAALHNQTHDRQTLSEQFDNLLNSFNACKEERNTLAAELSRVQDELKQLKEDTQHGLEQQEKSKKKVAALREEREALKLQCAQQDAAIESAKQQIAELEASLKEFLESRKTVEAAVRAVKAQNEELMQQLAAAREQAACSITTLEVIPDDIRNSFEVKRSPPRLGRLMSPCRSRSPLRRTSGGGAGGGTNSASSSMDSLPSPLPPSEKRDRELRGRSVSFSHSGEFSCSN